MAKYGMPYKGSKNKIAWKIFDLFPQKKNFYDLFAGGFAMTHYALQNSRFQNFYANDINPAVTELFKDAVAGKFKDEKRWISREDFFSLKDKEPYISVVWSFGNNLRDYLYAEDLEDLKKAWHYAIFFNDFSLFKNIGIEISSIKDIENRYEKYLTSKSILNKYRLAGVVPVDLERLQSLQSLERLERLERLENYDKLRINADSYENIPIQKDSIIYCDIPYENTNAYGNKNKQSFNFNNFYDWCSKQKEPLFISSYEMPKDKFVCVARIKHNSTLSATANNQVTEKVFIPKHQAKDYRLPNSLFNFDEM